MGAECAESGLGTFLSEALSVLVSLLWVPLPIVSKGGRLGPCLVQQDSSVVVVERHLHLEAAFSLPDDDCLGSGDGLRRSYSAQILTRFLMTPKLQYCGLYRFSQNIMMPRPSYGLFMTFRLLPTK